MGIKDIIVAAVILGGTFYLLYVSLWKKKGCTGNCSGGCCSKK